MAFGVARVACPWTSRSPRLLASEQAHERVAYATSLPDIRLRFTPEKAPVRLL